MSGYRNLFTKMLIYITITPKNQFEYELMNFYAKVIGYEVDRLYGQKRATQNNIALHVLIIIAYYRNEISFRITSLDYSLT